jgi:hypothetical protein
VKEFDINKYNNKIFDFQKDNVFESVNIFSGSLNTMIIFFWANHKLSNSVLNTHSNMLKMSYTYIASVYTMFILLKFLMVYDETSEAFPLCPKDFNYINNTSYYKKFFSLSEIVVNIANQIFMLNFYFLVIKNLIIRTSMIVYLKKKKYLINLF